MSAIVTGASRGIGLRISQLLASKGYQVHLVSSNQSNLSNALPLLAPTPNPHTATVLDLSQPHSIKDTLPIAKDVSVLVNCAGVSQTSLLARTTPEQIVAMNNINLVSPMVLSKLCLRRLIANKGQIINVASLLYDVDVLGTSVYAATKTGLVRFTRSLSYETNGKVRVNCLSPGYVATEMTQGLKMDQHVVSMDAVVNGVETILNATYTGVNVVIDDNGTRCENMH